MIDWSFGFADLNEGGEVRLFPKKAPLRF